MRSGKDRRATLIGDAARRAGAYLAGLNERGVAPSAEAVDALSGFAEAMPSGPADPAQVLAQLDKIGSPATVATASSRYFGFVIGGSLPAALAANVLAAAWDQNVSLRVMSPVGAALEDIALRWMIELFGFPQGTAGAFVTGATMANFTCLAAARYALLAQRGWNVDGDGLFGAPPIQVIVGAETHTTVFKALSLLGMGRDRVITVAADGQGRFRPDRFPRLSEPAIVCIQAGNVNTGAFDLAQEIIGAAKETESWVHVDGAFGLWAACAPGRAHLMAGYSGADSWATDAHKWLNVPYDCGLAFVRDAASAYAATNVQAAYFPVGVDREPMHWTPDSSRRARGVEVWAALKSLGRSGLAEMIERDCRCATRFADGLREAGYAVLNDVVLNQVLVSFGDAATTRAVIEGIQRDGTCWCGGTTWQGRAAMRISISSWLTTEEDVDQSLRAMVRVAHEITGGPRMGGEGGCASSHSPAEADDAKEEDVDAQTDRSTPRSDCR
jgi:glutamate/tyrosine decarboxylase-like PLP-dependent enzyme